MAEIKTMPVKVVPAVTLESMAGARASSDPLPGPLVKVFVSETIQAGSFEVRKLVAFDYVIFKFLDSPIMRQLLELSKPEDKRESVDPTDEETWEMCLQFTRSPKELRGYMKAGREAFREAATAEIGDKVSPEECQLIALAIFEQVKRNAETACQYMANAKEKGEITFLTPPPMTD